MKRAQIGTIFIYLISILIIILVIYFGYKAIGGISKGAEKIATEKFKSTFTDDMKSDAAYGSIHLKSYNIPSKYDKVCFIDLTKKGAIAGSVSVNIYPIIKDSIESNAQQNVFLLPSGEPFYAGEVSVPNYPYFTCQDVRNSMIRLRLEGLGSSTKIGLESISNVSINLDENNRATQEVNLTSSDGAVQLIIPASTQISPATNSFSVEVVSRIEATQYSEAYSFKPAGTMFNPAARLVVRYYPELIGTQCPSSMTFTYDNQSYQSVGIDCQDNLATFEISQI